MRSDLAINVWYLSDIHVFSFQGPSVTTEQTTITIEERVQIGLNDQLSQS